MKPTEKPTEKSIEKPTEEKKAVQKIPDSAEPALIIEAIRHQPVEERPISVLMKITRNRFSSRMNEVAEAYDLTSTQCDILGMISHHEPGTVSPVDIERRLHLSKATVSGLMKRLELKGYIRLEVNPEDHRSKQIFTTRKADLLQLQIIQSVDATEKVMLEGITPEEINMLRRLLLLMIDNLNQDQNPDMTAVKTKA